MLTSCILFTPQLELIKPLTGNNTEAELIKTGQSASPGYYQVAFTNHINAEFSVYQKSDMHRYTFPEGE